jgi:hypothetical protein
MDPRNIPMQRANHAGVRPAPAVGFFGDEIFPVTALHGRATLDAWSETRPSMGGVGQTASAGKQVQHVNPAAIAAAVASGEAYGSPVDLDDRPGE